LWIYVQIHNYRFDFRGMLFHRARRPGPQHIYSTKVFEKFEARLASRALRAGTSRAPKQKLALNDARNDPHASIGAPALATFLLFAIPFARLRSLKRTRS